VTAGRLPIRRRQYDHFDERFSCPHFRRISFGGPSQSSNSGWEGKSPWEPNSSLVRDESVAEELFPIAVGNQRAAGQGIVRRDEPAGQRQPIPRGVLRQADAAPRGRLPSPRSPRSLIIAAQLNAGSCGVGCPPNSGHDGNRIRLEVRERVCQGAMARLRTAFNSGAI